MGSEPGASGKAQATCACVSGDLLLKQIALAASSPFGRRVIAFSLALMSVVAFGFFYLTQYNLKHIREMDEYRDRLGNDMLIISETVLRVQGVMLPAHDIISLSASEAIRPIGDTNSLATLENEINETAEAQKALNAILNKKEGEVPLPIVAEVRKEMAAVAPQIMEIISIAKQSNSLAQIKGKNRERQQLLSHGFQLLELVHPRLEKLTARLDSKMLELKKEYARSSAEDLDAQGEARKKINIGFALLEILVFALGLVELAAVGKTQADEIRLKEGEGKYRHLIESTGDGVFISDAKTGIIIDVNKTAEGMIGRKREEIIGMHQTELHPPDKKEEYEYLFTSQMLMEDRGVLRNLLLRRSDGTDMPVDIRASMSHIGDQTIIQGIFRDMSYYVESERKIREQADFLERLMDSIPNPVFYKDAQGRYLGCNHAFESVFGFKANEIIGKDAFEIYTPELAVVYHEKDLELFNAPGQTQVYESITKPGGGGTRSIIIYKSCFFDATGQVAGIVGVGVDITERKELEREQVELIRQTVDALEEAHAERKNAEEANRLKSEFLANMSHELHTPLTSVIGYSRIAGDRCRDVSIALAKMIAMSKNPGGKPVAEECASLATGATEAVDDALAFNNVVVEQGQRLFQLISDLLDLSMLEAGQMKILSQVVSTFMLLASVRESQYRDAEAKGLTLTVNSKDFRNSDMVFMGDAKKLEHVLINLVQNAIKYSIKGEVRVTASRDGGNIVFSVSDKGIGIPDKERDRIFESFRQLDGSSTRTQGGVGLGLSLAKRLMDTMGGAISVESEVGKGSVFSVTLPYRAMDSSEA